MKMLKVELMKLMKTLNTKIFIGIYGLIFFGLTFFYVVAEKVFGFSIYTDIQFVKASLSTMMLFLLPLLAIYFAGQSQAIDFMRGTMKNMYLLPISRTKIWLSKVVAVWVFIGVLLSGQFILSLLVSMMVEGSRLDGLGRTIIQYLSAFVVLGLISLIGNMLALLFKNTGLSIIIAYAGYVGLGLLSIYFPIIKAVSITTIITNYHMLFNLNSLNVLLSTVAYYIIMMVVGLQLFEKKEESLCQFD